AVAACSSGTAKRGIVSAADAQREVALAYQDAVAAEDAAGHACRDAAKRAGLTLPDPSKEPAGAMRACSTLGYPIPFDPVKLHDFGGQINAAKDAVEAANVARKGI